MDAWKTELKSAITRVEEIGNKFNIDVKQLNLVAERYPLRITPYYFSLIERPGDPIWQQCVPNIKELVDQQEPDPLNEVLLSPVPGLIHRYPDRAVLLVSNACASYCRFCMRKRQVGCKEFTIDIDAAIDYIASTTTIRDLIISGGDPLLLDDCQLEEILLKLREISHLEIIRIGSRAPVTIPSRITKRLCRLLRRFQPVYLNTHFNHPREITCEASDACNLLTDAGIPLGNQTVLLHNVNDNIATMRELMIGLLKIRIKPYYLHQMDLVRGTAHFRTSVSKGLEIMNALRGHMSGLGIPHYVIDLPGGKGKAPLLPDNIRREGDLLQIKSYQGDVVVYHD